MDKMAEMRSMMAQMRSMMDRMEAMMDGGMDDEQDMQTMRAMNIDRDPRARELMAKEKMRMK